MKKKWIDLVINRQRNGKFTADPGCAVQVYTPAVGLHQVLGNTQAQAHTLLDAPALVSPVIGLKNFFLFIE
jgi:hypothetical protein